MKTFRPHRLIYLLLSVYILCICQPIFANVNKCEALFSAKIGTLETIVRRYRPKILQDIFSKPIRVYRGEASPTLGLNELFEFISGNPLFQPGSWLYNRILKENLASGMEPALAIARTKNEVAKQINTKIVKMGLWEFLKQEMMGTIAGRPENKKNAASIPTALDLISASMYGIQVFRAVTKQNPTTLLLVYDIIETTPKGFFRDKPNTPEDIGKEYFTLSHIPIRDVRGIYYGLVPKGSVEPGGWIYLDFKGRENLSGNVNAIDLYYVPNRSVERYQSGTLLSVDLTATKEFIGTAVKGGQFSLDADPLKRIDTTEPLENLLTKILEWVNSD